MIRSPCILCLTLGLAVIFSGCEKPEIQSYRVPREAPPVPPGMVPPTPDGSHADIHWTAPKEWKEQAPGQMRKASYLVEGKNGNTADFSVTVLPGEAGGDLANVNRWRGQIQLPHFDSLTDKNSSKIKSGSLEFLLVDFAAPASDKVKDPTRLMAAILFHDGQSWFFKLMGKSSVVESNRKSYMDFLKSVHFDSGSETAEEVQTPVPASSPHPTVAPSDKGATPDRPDWTLPAGWKDKPGSSMRVGSFSYTDSNHNEADISVLALSGEGGGLIANINMWRSQLQLAALDEKNLSSVATSITIDGKPATLVNQVSTVAFPETKQKARILVAMVTHQGQTWFFKMAGNDSVVEAQKQTFLTFLKSVHFH